MKNCLFWIALLCSGCSGRLMVFDGYNAAEQVLYVTPLEGHLRGQRAMIYWWRDRGEMANLQAGDTIRFYFRRWRLSELPLT